MTGASNSADVTRAFGAVARGRRRVARDRAGRILLDARAIGLGQDHLPAPDRRLRAPDAGHIRLDGHDVTAVPPYERDVNTVFQDYALFPHMSVAENVAYGLRVRGVAPAERRSARPRRWTWSLGFGDRRPNQLSGGQKQRVALARALVNRPRVLLLDEPLGALDLKLREEMQVELKSLQRRLGITFVFVTHDQGEALSMSDRVAVFNQGRIEQLDTPRGLYMRPRTAFVAHFVGSANVVDARSPNG